MVARTVLAFVANGQPFTDAFTSHQLMMTPAMMEFFGLASRLSTIRNKIEEGRAKWESAAD